MKNLLLILMTIAMLPSCSKDDFNDQDFVNNIIGEWEVLETGDILLSIGMKLTFKSDSFLCLNEECGIPYTVIDNLFRFDEILIEGIYYEIEYLNKEEMKMVFVDQSITIFKRL